jgi:hypothetical protein
VDPFHNFFVKVSTVFIENGSHGGFSHLATCEEMGLPMFLGDFNVVDLEASKALLLL